MKIIIWGHKTNGHTHSYIHYGYFKAFSSLGYETYWFDDHPNNRTTIDYNNSIFLTEGQVDKSIPLLDSCFYILHHCSYDKYSAFKYLNLCNYQRFCEDGKSPNYPDGKTSKIKDLCFYDEKNRALYQTWATDLLPIEIREDDAVAFDSSKEYIHFTGYIWEENKNQIDRFRQACIDNKKTLMTHFGVSNEENRRFTRDSYVSPDFRGDWHVECGYVPCRLYKSMSYGIPVGTNSHHLHSLFPSFVSYHKDSYELFNICVDNYRKMSVDDIRNAMRYVRENHTYVNRIENLLDIIRKDLPHI